MLKFPFILMLFLLCFDLTAGKPNFIYFLVDDLGYSDVACNGNTLHETPNVDRLAAEGVNFSNAYAAASICSPTRFSVQTGQYPVRLHLTDWIQGWRYPNTPLKEKHTRREMPLESVTIAEVLKDNGYRTAFIGKWHLNAKDQDSFFPEDQGYDINIGGHFKGSPPGGYFAPFKNPKMENKPDDHYLTDRLGDEAVDLIGKYAEQPDKPFFLMLSFYTVHTPIQPRKDLKSHYEEKLKTTKSHWDNPNYAAMVHSMDMNIGKILQALKEKGLDENTVIIFFSDNGGLETVATNYPLRKGKCFLYEGGIRVPLIIKDPRNNKNGQLIDQPVISNDIFPTILELADIDSSNTDHDGISLKSIMNGEDKLNREAIYWHYPHYHRQGETPSSAIRKENFKLVRHYENNSIELYNLTTDVGETKNLVKSMPDKKKEMEKMLDDWLQSHNAFIPKPNPDYDPNKNWQGK